KIEGFNFTRINNDTPGEIVTVIADSIGTIQAQNLGTPQHSTLAQIVGRDLLVPGANYPFNNQTTGVIAGDIVQVKSYGQVGNIIVNPALLAGASLFTDPRIGALGGGFASIGSVTADSNNKSTSGL